MVFRIKHGLEARSHDGLSLIQRAILLYVAQNPPLPNCSRLTKDLLAANGCPSDVGAEEIDATLLMMSHPQLCHGPLFAYYGGRVFPEGWMPGPVYRSVRPTLATYGFLQGCSPSSNWWTEDSLHVRQPYAALFGSASWEMEIQEGLPPHKMEQAERRMRCHIVHSLGCDPLSLVNATERFRETGDLHGCLTTINEDGPCLGFYVHRLQQAISESRELNNAETTLGLQICEHGRLPHGVMIGIQEPADDGTASSQVLVASIPILQVASLWVSTKRTALLSITEPACGRHMGQEMELLRETKGNVALVVGAEESPDKVEVLLPIDLSHLVHEIGFIPLPPDVFRAMLATGC